MLGRTKNKVQLDMFEVPLEKFIDHKHELAVGAASIDWDSLEEHFRPYYSHRGRPSIPPRKIVGMLLIKERFNLSDEKVLKIWPENPYWQYFCGEVHFQTSPPFSPGEFTSFRRRIGDSGHEIVRSVSFKHFGKPDDKRYKTYTDRRKRSLWRKLINP